MFLNANIYKTNRAYTYLFVIMTQIIPFLNIHKNQYLIKCEAVHSPIFRIPSMSPKYFSSLTSNHVALAASWLSLNHCSPTTSPSTRSKVVPDITQNHLGLKWWWIWGLRVQLHITPNPKQLGVTTEMVLLAFLAPLCHPKFLLILDVRNKDDTQPPNC